jgi:hypothetical protein
VSPIIRINRLPQVNELTEITRRSRTAHSHQGTQSEHYNDYVFHILSSFDFSLEPAAVRTRQFLRDAVQILREALMPGFEFPGPAESNDSS